jgi:hypothetical protein
MTDTTFVEDRRYKLGPDHFVEEMASNAAETHGIILSAEQLDKIYDAMLSAEMNGHGDKSVAGLAAAEAMGVKADEASIAGLFESCNAGLDDLVDQKYAGMGIDFCR